AVAVTIAGAWAVPCNSPRISRPFASACGWSDAPQVTSGAGFLHPMVPTSSSRSVLPTSTVQRRSQIVISSISSLNDASRVGTRECSLEPGTPGARCDAQCALGLEVGRPPEGGAVEADRGSRDHPDEPSWCTKGLFRAEDPR